VGAAPSVAPSEEEVVLVHDYLLVMRGAERTVAAITKCWPSAPVYTLLHDAKRTNGAFEERVIRTSYLQRAGMRQGSFRWLLPFFPRAAERLLSGQHDVVLSSSSAFAHGVTTPPGAQHVCYCHSPFRYAWHERGRALEEAPAPLRPAVDKLLGAIRRWDRQSTEGVTHYIANSKITRQRIRDFWGRDASIVHPPVAVERFHRERPEDFFLFVGEVVRHKRLELALRAARKARVPLKVVGTGPDLDRLEAEYGDSADFVGRVGDGRLESLYARARALVVPNVEEFGITAVEAQAAGRPVVAAAAGGALETVVDGETGVHFPPDDVDALAEIMRYSDFERFEPERIVRRAQRFSVRRFQKRLRGAVRKVAGQAAPPRLPAAA
jgi:glycosyltransferase involved in cell wall biosynthesis